MSGKRSFKENRRGTRVKETALKCEGGEEGLGGVGGRNDRDEMLS